MSSRPQPHRFVGYRTAGLVILLLGVGAGLIAALIYGGAAAPNLLHDPGPLVRWGLPIARTLNSVAGAAMIGAPLLALFALKAGTKPFDTAFDLASFGAAIFTVTAAAVGFLTFLSSFPVQLSLQTQFGEQFGSFLLETELGLAWLIMTLMGAVITILAFAWRSWTPSVFTTVLAVAALIPIATQGHSGGLAGHTLAVNAILLHTVAAAVWIGGIMLIILLRGQKGVDLVLLVRRYSAIALAAFVIVAFSGIARSIVALESWSGLATPYGGILLAKVALLVGLGFFGARYRLAIIPKLHTPRSQRAFWMLILGEAGLMGLASGAATALAATEPPAGETEPDFPTPAEILTKTPLPPELTLDRWFTAWDFDVLWLIVAGFGIGFYLLGVYRLHKRGDRWPIQRTVFWVLGMLLLIWVTCGSVNAYQEYLFSVHMLGHMLLSMAIPMLLVTGTPITLALRAIQKRDDGTRGGREWILWLVHSPYARILTHPIVAAAIFILSLWAFYFTDLVRWAMYEHLGHEWMIIHFLLSGYLFVMSLVGADPVSYRLPYPGRLITLIAVMAMHAFFGIAIMMQEGLIVAEWFGSMGRTWGPTPMEDQYIGGGIAWSIGEIPTLILAITVAIQWSRSDGREQKRRDRQADRSGDAELEEYNAQLAALAERDRRSAGR